MWKPLALGVGVIVMTVGTCVTSTKLVTPASDTRSVRLLDIPPETAKGFSRAESAGLFVGVRTFPYDDSLTVPYAVDDAVDLAHKFSLSPRSSLVPPRRVVLALSGQPQKEDSKRRLRELKAAGARVADATTGDILQLLQEQAAAASNNGLLILSLATHGFMHDGDSYILGSTSKFKSPQTSLRTVTLFDIALRAPRSLIFVDACRDRAGKEARSVAPDPATAAPLLNRMRRVQGQVIFYAAAQGKYAYDDHVHQNGVFTKAVLDGLNCAASAPRGVVLIETLQRYVERNVRQWLENNNKDASPPVTQISMEGVTRNMPVSECWRNPGPELRVSVDGTTLTAYGSETRPLWRKSLGANIIGAEAADLDADAFYEVVAGTREELMVLDRDGEPVWTKTGAGSMKLRNFTTGDLHRKHTAQIVALWVDERTSRSRLSVFTSDGTELANTDLDGVLEHVAIGRQTNRHAPKIALTQASMVFVFDPKRVADGQPLWRRTSSNQTIEKLKIVDDGYTRHIAVTTQDGTTLFTFDGTIVSQSGSWEESPKKKRRRAS